MTPAIPRVPLWLCGVRIGDVEFGLITKAGLDRMQHGGSPLVRLEVGVKAGWHVSDTADKGHLTQTLAFIADGLRAAGLAGAWREEQLAVNDHEGRCIATIERGVVRALGITTLAVHLVGKAPDGRFWIQQRALDKPNDPGLWDTLMGGMVSAADTAESALARETWEEAGLHIAQLQHLRPGGRLKTARPSTDGQMGYVREYIDWFTCTVPDGMEPVNQDGEVAQFVLMEPQEVIDRMTRDEFTTEAALILADAMGLVS